MKLQMLTAPSLLACDFLHLEDEVIRAEKSGSDWLHLDVMDGVYVPNLSFGFDIISKLRTVSNLYFDVHMMTVCPEKYLEVLKKAGASSVNIHSDVLSKEKTIETLKAIKALGMDAAVALKPKVAAEEIADFIPYCDMVLVMTVEPGFGGQKFMADMMPKVKAIREMANAVKPELNIQVDGGVSAANIAQCAEAGANVFVVGTSSFRAPDMQAALAEMKAIAENAVK
ncbi:MAG: ribulose-phosphate 3-epimerase [Clostridia bacterium]|nr:ribulose-phosphate 3-epimerase [Clostridia bacterium]